MASQITSLTIVYSSVYSGVDQRKHQSSMSLAFVQEIHRWPVNSLHKWPVTRKMFPFDDVIMMRQLTEVIIGSDTGLVPSHHLHQCLTYCQLNAKEHISMLPSSLLYKAHLSRQLNCWSLGCSWSIPCRRCSNYIFILNLTPGFNGLGKDNYKMTWKAFKFWDLEHLILETLWYLKLKFFIQENVLVNAASKNGCNLSQPQSGKSMMYMKCRYRNTIHTSKTLIILLGAFINIIFIDVLVQDCSNCSGVTMELLQSCTKPSIYHF